MVQKSKVKEVPLTACRGGPEGRRKRTRTTGLVHLDLPSASLRFRDNSGGDQACPN